MMFDADPERSLVLSANHGILVGAQSEQPLQRMLRARWSRGVSKRRPFPDFVYHDGGWHVMGGSAVMVENVMDGE